MLGNVWPRAWLVQKVVRTALISYNLDELEVSGFEGNFVLNIEGLLLSLNLHN